jgi:hypothetical protein
MHSVYLMLQQVPAPAAVPLSPSAFSASSASSASSSSASAAQVLFRKFLLLQFFT